MAAGTMLTRLLITVIIHLVFLASVFDIYFKSPIMEPFLHHKPGYESGTAPAKRVVIFVSDGLQADSFYEKNGIATPYLRSVIQSTGVWGLSHTRVPTETRPGHMALFAGMFEDPSAITKGWKENPVEADSLFHQAKYGWVFGAPKVVAMFTKGMNKVNTEPRIFGYTYPGHIEKTGQDMSKLNIWVFDHLKEVLYQAALNDEKLNSDGLLFLVHLPGGDHIGHMFKPHSNRFASALKIIDDGIKATVKNFEDYWKHDGRTTYIFTADHGMTNWGSHGAGTQDETETPFVAWGAGIRSAKTRGTNDPIIPRAKEWNLEDLEMVNLNQTDLPPLVASLLDINMPSNSLGKLSTRVLNMTHKQVIKAKIANGMQIHEQVLSYQSYYGDTLLTSQAYGGLDLPSILSIVGRITQLQNNFAFQAASDLADDMYNICLDGLIYYQRYHRFPLYVAISVSYLGFIAYLGISLIKGSSQSSVLTPRNTLMVLIGLILTGLFTYFQNAPAHYFIYYSTPVFVLTLTYNELLFLLKSKSNNLSFPLLWNDFQQLSKSMMMSLVVVEILVAAFFERRLFTIALLIVMMWQLYSHSKKSPMTLRILWVFLCLTLCLFTFQPSIHKQKSNFLVLSASLLSCGVSLFLHNKKTNAVNVGQHWSMTILAPFVITSGVCVWITDSGSDLAKEFSQYVAWMILITAIPISLLSPRALIPRLISLSMALLSIYILLCISYEALFLLCLMGTMFTWLTMNALENQDQNKTKTSTRADPKDVMTALMFLLFSLTSFFGTGNVASINSFDPKSIQTLVSVFNTYIMGGLLMLKILLPLLMVSVFSVAVQKTSKVSLEALFTLVLLFCDIMGIHFFFLVTDKGSWLEIGVSLSHFIISEAIAVFLQALFLIAKILMDFPGSSCSRSQRQELPT